MSKVKTKLKKPEDIKIFILHLLRKVSRPLLFNELNDCALQDGFVSYMAFAECLSDLVDTGNVTMTSTENGDLYEITPQGAAVDDQLSSSIGGFIRTKSVQSALRYLSFKERHIRTPVTSIPRGDGSYDMIFSLTEENVPLFSLSVVADNDYMEAQMRINFQSDPERIYRSILALVSGETDYILK